MCRSIVRNLLIFFWLLFVFFFPHFIFLGLLNGIDGIWLDNFSDCRVPSASERKPNRMEDIQSQPQEKQKYK